MYSHKEGCGGVKNQNHRDFAHEGQRPVVVPHGREEIPPQFDNVAMVDFFASIRNTVEDMAAIVMRQNTRMNPPIDSEMVEIEKDDQRKKGKSGQSSMGEPSVLVHPVVSDIKNSLNSEGE